MGVTIIFAAFWIIVPVAFLVASYQLYKIYTSEEETKLHRSADDEHVNEYRYEEEKTRKAA